MVYEEGEPYFPSSMSSSMGLSSASSKKGTLVRALMPRSNGSEANNGASAMLIPRHHSVLDHLKELVLLGCLR